MRLRTVVLAMALGLCATQARAQETPAGEEPELVAVGEREGPRVWRVLNGDKELVILGGLSPLPKGVTWRSRTVEALVGDADLVMPTTLNITFPEIGPFKAIGLLFAVKKESKAEQGVRLQDSISPELYARFSALRRKYGGPESWDKLRPLAAAAKIGEAAFDSANIRSFGLTEEIARIAKKKKRPWKPVKVEFRGNAKELVKEVFEKARPHEEACLRETIDIAEKDLPALRSRAAAWARGDVAALSRLPRPQQAKSCQAILFTADALRDLRAEGEKRVRQQLFSALERNDHTFVVTNIDELLFGDLLASFEAKGYRVIRP